MKTKICLYIFFLIAFFPYCGKSTNRQNQQETLDTIPKGAIKLQYEERKHPRLEGLINDSIKCSMMWDTGVADDIIIVNDSLFNLYGDSALVRVGKFEKKLKVVYYKSKELFQAIGNNTAIIGKDFFKGKIIEVSLAHRYLREVENLDAVKDNYSKIKLQKALHLNLPINTLYIQGKEINAFLIFDTGSDGTIYLNYLIGVEHGLDLSNILPTKAIMANGKLAEKSGVTMDSILLNNQYMINKEYPIVFMKYPNPDAMIGGIGCGILDDFTFILDQVNYDLYLKPLDCDIKQQNK